MEDQKQVVDALLSPVAYPHYTGEIDLIQTHISFVFLTQEYVYKVKKAVNFGFLDFSTLDKRRMFCEKELQLNKRLCPEIYLEVVSINKSDTIKISGSGEVVEYALKMKRLSQERIMTQLVRQNKINKKTVEEIARIIAIFHSTALTSLTISEFGSIEVIKTNWNENFAQTKGYIDKTILQTDFNFIQTTINTFIEENKRLFESRIVNKRIRDCHGDLHSGNIFITEKICIFDAIEFNDRFRYSDVAADLAFLAMDLDFQQKPELAKYFIEKYVEFSNDQQIIHLLAFYKCYRAYVRGKVVSFRLDDLNITDQEKSSAILESQAYFKLAAEYAKSL